MQVAGGRVSFVLLVGGKTCFDVKFEFEFDPVEFRFQFSFLGDRFASSFSPAFGVRWR